LTGCVIDRNVTTSNGGGILVQFGANVPTFLRCTFSGNTGFYSGCAYIGNGAQPIFANCVFSGNVAMAFGGTIYVNLTSPEFLNCTIASNMANTYGGGLYLFSSATPVLTNTIIYDNSSRAID
jgi:parallel beta-helix repeat protein